MQRHNAKAQKDRECHRHCLLMEEGSKNEDEEQSNEEQAIEEEDVDKEDSGTQVGHPYLLCSPL